MKAQLHAHWCKQAILPLVALVAIALYFVLIAANAAGIPDTLDNRLNVVFMVIGFVLMALLFLDFLFRQNVSHILLVVVSGLYLLAYMFAKMLASYLSGTNTTLKEGVFFTLTLLAMGFMIYYYIKKGLDGDASFWYYAVAIAVILFFFFAVISNYSLFDAYGNKDNPSFWPGLFSSRIMVYIFILITATNINNDYDPNPIQLDEFGNPIDEQKNGNEK
jgi:hypothetical protein